MTVNVEVGQAACAGSVVSIVVRFNFDERQAGVLCRRASAMCFGSWHNSERLRRGSR